MTHRKHVYYLREAPRKSHLQHAALLMPVLKFTVQTKPNLTPLVKVPQMKRHDFKNYFNAVLKKIIHYLLQLLNKYKLHSFPASPGITKSLQALKLMKR